MPVRGMNWDTGQWGIDPDEASFLINAFLGEAPSIRPRLGFKGAGSTNFSSLLTVWDSDRPMGSVVYKDKILTWFCSAADAAAYQPNYYFDGNDANGSAAPASRYWIVSDYSAWPSAPTHTKLTPLQIGESFGAGTQIPSGLIGMPGVAYERAVYWPAGTSGAGVPMVTKWAGAVTAADNSRTVTLNNGNSSGTFGVAPPTSMKDMFLTPQISIGGGIYNFWYRISAHNAGAVGFTIDKPYGLGFPVGTVPNLVAGSTVWLSPLGTAINTPWYTRCLAVHLDRLFCGGGYVQTATGSIQVGLYGNLVQWMRVTEPSIFDTGNITVMDDRPDDSITAMFRAGRALAIARYNSLYVLRGYDEQSFSIDRVSSEVGCIDGRGVVPYRDGAFFPTPFTLYYYDGAKLQDVFTKRPGKGIRSAYQYMLNDVTVASEGVRPRRANRIISGAVVNDHLLLQIKGDQRKYGAGQSVLVPQCLACYLPTESWTFWSGQSPTGVPMVNDMPWYLLPSGMQVNTRTLAIQQRGNYVDVGMCWQSKPLGSSVSDSTTATEFYDEFINTSGGGATQTRQYLYWRTKKFEWGGGQQVMNLTELFATHSFSNDGTSANNVGESFTGGAACVINMLRDNEDFAPGLKITRIYPRAATASPNTSPGIVYRTQLTQTDLGAGPPPTLGDGGQFPLRGYSHHFQISISGSLSVPSMYNLRLHRLQAKVEPVGNLALAVDG